jgi:hypothetical protein
MPVPRANVIALAAPKLGWGNDLEAVSPTTCPGGGVCDAVDMSPASNYLACPNMVAFLREGKWGLCRKHAYNPVLVDKTRQRK